MIKEMNYDTNFVSLVTELAAINPQLIFKKSEEGEDAKVSVKAIEGTDKSVCFFLDAPASAFDFKSDSLAVIDFKRFVSYYNTFNKPNKDEKLADSPVLSVEYNDDEATEAIVMHIKSKKGKASFRHRLANEDVIVKPTFSKVKFPSTDAKFSLTKNQIDELNKLISLTAADRIKWSFNGSLCTITLFNTRTSDTYENDYALSTSTETPFEFTTLSKGFGLLPEGSFNVEVCKNGIMDFKQDRDDKIDLQLYIAKNGK